MLFEIAHAGVISDAPEISQVLINAFNFLLSIFGMFAIIGLAVSGIIYLTSGGSEERIGTAKKSFAYSIAGIAVVLGMMVIIKTIENLIK